MFTDIHNHLLPGLDDGAETMEEAIACSKKYVSEGIGQLIVTPHHKKGVYSNPAVNLKQEVKNFRKQLTNKKIPLKIVPAQEILVYPNLIKDIEKGNQIFLLGDSNYVLLELPTYEYPSYVEAIINDLFKIGVIPIIVHPERYLSFQKNTLLFPKLKNRGVKFQISSTSLVNNKNKRIYRLSWKLLKLDYIDYIASDAHGYKRKNTLIEAYDLIERKIGEWSKSELVSNSNQLFTQSCRKAGSFDE